MYRSEHPVDVTKNAAQSELDGHDPAYVVRDSSRVLHELDIVICKT